MIRTENGKTEIKGTPYEILTDCSCISEAVKDTFLESKIMPEKRIREMLHECVDDGFKSEAELDDEIKSAVTKLLKEFIAGGDVEWWTKE